jgi:hypothetical protein
MVSIFSVLESASREEMDVNRANRDSSVASYADVLRLGYWNIEGGADAPTFAQLAAKPLLILRGGSGDQDGMSRDVVLTENSEVLFAAFHPNSRHLMAIGHRFGILLCAAEEHAMGAPDLTLRCAFGRVRRLCSCVTWRVVRCAARCRRR